MSLVLPPGQLESFIGTFYKVNAKRPPAKPEYAGTGALERLVIAKGMLQMHIGEQQAVVNIPDAEQVDQDTYRALLPLLVNQLAQLLQVPHHSSDIAGAMERCGLIAYFQGSTLRMNPLTPGFGESDQF
jgi:hypothetical protein